MRKLVISEWITLDGIFDAASMAQWFMPYDSAERQDIIREGILSCDAILFGRKTYEMLAPYWSQLRNNEMGIADKLNQVQKYVVSQHLQKADWQNTTIISGDVVAAIKALKEQPGREIQIEGSAGLVQSLIDADLIDEYTFIVHPVIMGTGLKFFKEGQHPRGLQLVESRSLDKGVMMLTYTRTPAA